MLPRQRIDDDRQGVLPAFIRMALADQPLTLFGKGQQVRDCLYVDDAVEAFLVAGATDDVNGEAFNVGGEESKAGWDAADESHWNSFA